MSRRRTASDSTEITTDICVIGAGPAGITIARELDGRGVDVCLLEAGGLDVERRVQAQSRGESDGLPLHPLDQCRVRAFGGTLRHPRVWDVGWAARPFDSIDFVSRPWVPHSGWPFDRAHLDPYYSRANEICGVLPLEQATAVWRDHASAEARALDDEMGATVFQYPTGAFHDAWDDLSRSANVRVLLHTRVAELVVDESGRRIERVVAVHNGRERVVLRPRLVVLATGGIENARLLLLADEGRGVGNEHDQVGRYFAERLCFYAGHLELVDPNLLGPLSSFQQGAVGPIGGALRVRDHLQQSRELLNFALFLVPRPGGVQTDSVRSLATLRKGWDRQPRVAALGEHARNILTGPKGFVDVAMSAVLDRPKALMIRAQGEQAPHPDSRVTLGRGRDDLGLPVARVTWQMRDADLESVTKTLQVLDDSLRAGGWGHVSAPNLPRRTTMVEGAHHHLGTTRMHEDSRKGVVDADCRVHSVDNLYVTGMSVFPTFGASNPTLTIVALALRLADHLRQTVGQLQLEVRSR
jgi:choline dehydrogenase-like flavoprotein